MPAATFGHSSQAGFLISAMPRTVQHFVQEPQDLPATMDGFKAAFQSSGYSDLGGTGAPVRLAPLRFASPIAQQFLHRSGTETCGRRLGEFQVPPQAGRIGRALPPDDDFLS